MVLGRRELSVVLLVFGAIISVYMVLLAGPTSAQQGGGSTGGGGNSTGQNGDCPGAQVVNTTTGNGNKQTPIFNIAGTSFRITTTIQPTSADPQLAGVTAFVETETNEPVADFSKEGGGTDSSIINAGPGQFFLDLSTANAEYTVTVEDCTESGQGSSNQNNQNSVSQGQSNAVITNTIPNKPLPPTGGWPVYALVASSILAGAGLLGIRLGIWRGRR